MCTRGVDRPCKHALDSLQDMSAAWLACLKMGGWLLMQPAGADWHDIALEVQTGPDMQQQ